MGMDLEYGPAPQGPRLHRRVLKELGRRILETYRYDTNLWRTALSGPWTLCILAFSIVIMGIPTGLGSAADIMLAVGAGTLVMALASNLLAVLLSLTGLRFPHLFAGSLLSTYGTVLLILYFSDLELEAAAVIACIAALAFGLGGLAAGLLRTRRMLSGSLLAAALLLSPSHWPMALGRGAVRYRYPRFRVWRRTDRCFPYLQMIPHSRAAIHSTASPMEAARICNARSTARMFC